MNELLNILADTSYTTEQKIDALEDGAFLASIGITDADQEKIEELHAELKASL